MSSEFIYEETRRLTRKFGSNDPFRIAKELGIHVTFDNDFKMLKGMYLVIKRSRFIFINGNFNKRDRRTVCAHELGHDRFHRHFAKSNALQEFMLYDMQSRPEYEANIFASEILINDDEILELINDEHDICYIAGILGENINMVLIKIDELRKKGYDLSVPYRPYGAFLGN